MIPTPSVPSDNLYKFTAIFGLVLFLTSGLFIGVSVARGLMWRMEKTIEWTMLDERQNLFEARRKFMTTDAVLATQDTLIDLLTKRNVEIKVYAAITNLPEAEALLIVPFLLMLAGIGLAWRGFWLWYHRVQKYLDRELAGSQDATGAIAKA